jgi:hypothetical protein
MEFDLANFQGDAFRDSARVMAESGGTMNATELSKWAQDALRAMLARIERAIAVEEMRRWAARN